jgi:hypothetical protein
MTGSSDEFSKMNDTTLPVELADMCEGVATLP